MRVTVDLQADFALNQPLSPFVLEAIPRLDEDSPTHALDVLSIVEATLDDPGPILAAQLDHLKGEVVAQLKSEGVEYDERMAELDKLEYPKPLRDFTYDLFDAYRLHHPWVADHNIRPKSVARDLFERAMGFADYVAHYGITRSEGLLLRYLSDAYKGLTQSVPEDDKTDELLDLTEWLGELVRQVDSSLLDEWERLRLPVDDLVTTGRPATRPGRRSTTAPPPITRQPPGVPGHGAQRRVPPGRAGGRPRLEHARRARRRGRLGRRRLAGRRWPRTSSSTRSVGIGPEARSPALFQVTEVDGPSGPRGGCARCSTTPTASTSGASCSRSTWPRPMWRAWPSCDRSPSSSSDAARRRAARS